MNEYRILFNKRNSKIIKADTFNFGYDWIHFYKGNWGNNCWNKKYWDKERTRIAMYPIDTIRGIELLEEKNVKQK